MEDILDVGGRKLKSRFFLGTGKFPRKSMIREAIESSGAEVVTVALRRVDAVSEDENVLDHIPENCVIMANTSGARNADEAIRLARLARASGCGNWIKIEVIPDNKYLLPDNSETLRATEVLVKEGFTVLPYMNPDLIFGLKMAKAGASAIMPLGALIGSNRGFRTEEIVKVMIREIDVPVVVDAGIGRPSDAARCMELGAGAVLVNTALITSKDPVSMARAFGLAIEAGRVSYVSGQPSAVNEARASSPFKGFLRKVTDESK
jgi:thiazole synthase